MSIIKKILSYFGGKKTSECSVWEHGYCNGTPARRHKIKGNIQFVMWKAGEQGHKEDCWINFDSSWWSEFRSTDITEKGCLHLIIYVDDDNFQRCQKCDEIVD